MSNPANPRCSRWRCISGGRPRHSNLIRRSRLRWPMATLVLPTSTRTASSTCGVLGASVSAEGQRCQFSPGWTCTAAINKMVIPVHHCLSFPPRPQTTLNRVQPVGVDNARHCAVPHARAAGYSFSRVSSVIGVGVLVKPPESATLNALALSPTNFCCCGAIEATH